ncbi:MAG: TonB family protein, partial [Blastocatellia bacterium]
IEQPCMVARLRNEMQDAWREFRENPRVYVTSALNRDARGNQRDMLLRVGLAIALLMYAFAFVSMLVFWSLANHQSKIGSNSIYINTHLAYWPKAELPDSADKPGGGGGGGHDEQKPPSGGNLPVFTLADPIVAPNPKQPPSPQTLPIIETVKVDPRIQFERDELTPTGLPDFASALPSSGPGSERGIGTGSKGGIGTGIGPGVGQGKGGNIGDEGFQIGGRPRAFLHQPVVDARPVLLNEPRPLYSEEARQRKIQGVVRIRLLVDETGAVKEVVILRGLPGGLNEQAIRAAYQMRFRPAMKDGKTVPYWLSNVEIEFNLR